MLKIKNANFMMRQLGELFPAPPVSLDHRILYELLVGWSAAFRTSGRCNTTVQISLFLSNSTAIISSFRNVSS